MARIKKLDCIEFLLVFSVDFGGMEKTWMISALTVRKRVTMGVEVGNKRGERGI